MKIQSENQGKKESDNKLIARAFTLNQFMQNKFSSSNLSSNINQSSIQTYNKQSSIEKIGNDTTGEAPPQGQTSQKHSPAN